MDAVTKWLNKDVKPSTKENEYKQIKVKMKFTSETEKEGVKRAFNTFLAQRGIKFKALCLKKGLDYSKEYQKIYRGNIKEEDVNRLARLIDPAVSLRSINNTFVINRGLTGR